MWLGALRRIETKTARNIETDLEFVLRPRQPGLVLDHSEMATWLRPKPAESAPFSAGDDSLSGCQKIALLDKIRPPSISWALCICAPATGGKFKVKTIDKRLGRGLKAVWQWYTQQRPDPVSEQQKTLNAKLRGHYQY